MGGVGRTAINTRIAAPSNITLHVPRASRSRIATCGSAAVGGAEEGVRHHVAAAYL